MSDVKWIKITTDIFSDEKILLIEQLPDADTIIVIWFKLLCMAGRDNNNGIFVMNNKMPYTEEMLATLFRRPLNTVRLALATFEAYGMIDIIDDVITLTNWEKHQNVEGMERIKEQTRKRMQDYRARKRLGITSVGENCVYCGRPANAVDHIIPKAKGGQDIEWNLVPCCKSCNSSKKDKDLDEFLNDSFFYHYQNVDHTLVRANEKLMALVTYDAEENRYSKTDALRNNYVELRNRIEEEKNKNRIDKKKEKKKKETTHTLFERLLPDYNIPENLQAKMREWMTYKTERKDTYQEQGMKSLLRQIENNQLTYGEQAVCDLIDESMANGWKGIIFDKLKKQTPTKQETVPSWMKKKNSFHNFNQRSYDNDDLEKMMLGTNASDEP